MFTYIHTIKEPSLEEQLVQSTVAGLRQLEQVLGYEFAETIDTIEKLHELNSSEWTDEQEQAVQDFKLEFEQEFGTPLSEIELEFETRGINPMQKYEYLSRGEA
jgi:DNA replication protein DnaD